VATYEVHGSDGAVYRIEGPDDADPSAIIAQVTGQHRFGSGKSFDALPGGGVAPTGSPEAKAAQSPVSDSATQNFLAGAGKATVDLGRGIGQLGAGIADLVNPRDQSLSGLVTGQKPPSRVDEWRQAVADSRARDAALMKTGAGKAGFITGNIADSLPAAFIPGAGTLSGAAALGAGLGALQPSVSTGETLSNIGLGAAAGPASIAIGRGVAAAGRGAVAALEPLFRGGQERIAARTLQAFAGGPQAAADAANAILTNGRSILQGVEPTTAELANNAGIAQLERTLRNNPEALQALTARNQANRAAMTGALDQIAGTPQAMEAATTARAAATRPLYDAAAQTVVPADAELGRLLARPSMTRAWDRAQQLAAERGVQLAQPNANDISGQTLQYLKMGLNDLRDTGRQSGMGAHEQRALDSTLAELNQWTTRNVPQLRAADAAFRDLSQPINQMEVGGALRDRLVPALGDFGNNTRLSANSYANAVRNGDALAANATGLPNATLPGVLSAPQMTTIRQVGEQLARRANADELGRAVGSNTGQNLASQNVLRQFLGPLGLPQNMGERAAQSTLGQTLLRPMQFVAAAGEPRILQRLADASLNPQEAQRLLRLAQTNPRLAQMIWARQGLLAPLGQQAVGGLLGNSPQ